jgi:putative transposase
VDVRAVTVPDRGWVTVITRIPLRKRFLYLEAFVDLFSGNLQSCKMSKSLDTEFFLQDLGSACFRRFLQ